MESPTTRSSVLRKSAVRDDASSVTVHIPNVQSDGGAQIRLERQGTTVSAIHVTCKCGHRITIDCEYEK